MSENNQELPSEVPAVDEDFQKRLLEATKMPSIMPENLRYPPSPEELGSDNEE